MVARLAVLAATVLAVGLATVEPHAAAGWLTSSAAPAPPALAPTLRPQLDSAIPCAVTTGNGLGVCQRPFVGEPTVEHRAATVAYRPALMLCPAMRETPFMRQSGGPPSICGAGFHPHDRVDVIAQGRYGSTLWQVTADLRGGIRSALPLPLCALTPGSVSAVDAHDARSNVFKLSATDCPARKRT